MFTILSSDNIELWGISSTWICKLYPEILTLLSHCYSKPCQDYNLAWLIPPPKHQTRHRAQLALTFTRATSTVKFIVFIFLENCWIFFAKKYEFSIGITKCEPIHLIISEEGEDDGDCCNQYWYPRQDTILGQKLQKTRIEMTFSKPPGGELIQDAPPVTIGMSGYKWC